MPVPVPVHAHIPVLLPSAWDVSPLYSHARGASEGRGVGVRTSPRTGKSMLTRDGTEAAGKAPPMPRTRRRPRNLGGPHTPRSI